MDRLRDRLRPDAGPRRHGEGFSPELRFLLHLLRVALGTEERGEGPSTGDRGLDWAAFVAGVVRHRVGAFLVQRLPHASRARLPPEVLRALLSAAAVTVERAAVRSTLLRRLVRLMDAAAIPVVSVKGPLLARELHGSTAARHAGDLDLLIGPSHVDRADTLLRRAGCERRLPAVPLTPRQRRLFEHIHHEFTYTHTDTGVAVELTWRLDGAELTREVAGERPRVVDLEGQPIRLLAPDTEALYLLLHGARHGWIRLFWLVDVAVLLQDPDMDWGRVLARAERLGARRSVWQGALLARELLGVALPPGLGGPIPERRAVGRLVRDACRHITGPGDRTEGGDRPLWRMVYRMRRHDGWTAGFHELRMMLLAPWNWNALLLHDRWFVVRYLVTPALWARRRLRRLLRTGSEGR